MQKYIIKLTNRVFISKDDGAEYTDLAEARHAAIQTAAKIATGEISDDCPSIVVEAAIIDDDDSYHARLAVALCVADLGLPDISK